MLKEDGWDQFSPTCARMCTKPTIIKRGYKGMINDVGKVCVNALSVSFCRSKASAVSASSVRKRTPA